MDTHGPSDHRAGRTRRREEYAQKIYQLRDKLDLTQKQLAEHLKVGRGAVARWELGEREPEDRNYSALAKLAEERKLFELEGFFWSRTGRRRRSREENDAVRYLAAVEREAADGQKEARYLLELCELPRYAYYRKVMLAVDRMRAGPAGADTLLFVAQKFEEAWRVTTLQLGRMCRDKRSEEARLRSNLEKLEKASPQQWERK
jgi:transcriptional regulator with XRE-family HTH domain